MANPASASATVTVSCSPSLPAVFIPKLELKSLIESAPNDSLAPQIVLPAVPTILSFDVETLTGESDRKLSKSVPNDALAPQTVLPVVPATLSIDVETLTVGSNDRKLSKSRQDIFSITACTLLLATMRYNYCFQCSPTAFLITCRNGELGFISYWLIFSLETLYILVLDDLALLLGQARTKKMQDGLDTLAEAVFSL